MKWLPLLILFAIYFSGCNHPPGPLQPPEKPFFSDGCSCFPDLGYSECCVDHDRIYWLGGTPDQRRAADDALRQCIAAEGRPVLSQMAFWGVRLGGHGWLPEPWRWGFGRRWPDGYYSKP